MWLWAAASGGTEVFRWLPGRGGEQAKDLLGETFSGIIHRDRWKPHEQLPHARNQLCHAPIRRHLQAILEGKGKPPLKAPCSGWDNEAELALRKAVLWRRGCIGVNSEEGARFVERILSLAGTARRRGLDLLAWLTRALQADLDGLPAPALT